MGCGSYQCSVGTASHPGQPPALPASSHWTLAFLPLPLPSPFYQPNTTTSIPESQTALWFTTRKWLSVGREDCFLRDWRWPSSYQTQSNTVSLPSTALSLFYHLPHNDSLHSLIHLVAPRTMWDLSSLNRDGTLIPCIGRQSLKPLDHRGSFYSLHLFGETHWLKLPTLARHQSNYLHELFHNRS